MSSMLDDVNHLSREIGARPAGTEEERLAAMYIAENIQKRSGLPFDIEDFEGAKGRNRASNVLSIVSVVLFFLAVLLPVMTIPSFVLTLAIAIVCFLEFLDKPILSNFFRYGISQNVVARYVPAYSSDSSQIQRKRKVVFVSHYDSGRSMPDNTEAILNISYWTSFLAVVSDCIIAIFLLVKIFAFPETSGALTLFCVVFALIMALICVSPSLVDVYKSRLLYNEGANCNASGNAALIEIAKQLGTGAYSTDEDFESRNNAPVVHGEDAAKSAGVIPEGANISYETSEAESSTQEKTKDEVKQDVLEKKEQSLIDAKAAVAAFMAPRKPRAKYDDEGNVVDEGLKTDEEKPQTENITIDDATAIREEVKADTTASIPAYKTETKPSGEVPDWFKSAQSKAKKKDNSDEKDENDPSQRSRFAHTMDVMAQKQEEEEAKKKAEEEEKRAKLRAQIEAANKAAEEERQKKFGDKKPFYREEKQEDNTEKIDAIAETEKKEELSLDESFKQSFTKDVKDKSIEEKVTEAKVEEKKSEEAITEETKPEEIKVEETKVDEAITEEPKAEEEIKQELKPEDSGQINVEKMQQYAPLDDQQFISSNEMPENDALTELPEVFTDEKNIEENPEYAKVLKEDDAKVEKAEEKKENSGIEKGKFGTGSFAAVSESEGVAGATGTFAPVQEELMEDASKSGEISSKEDMVIADADDSVYNKGEFTDTGAFAGKGYVDMPGEKKKGLFGKFSRKDKGAGKHASQGDDFIDFINSDDDNVIDDNAWEGGAFSNLAGKVKLPKKNNKDEIFDEVEPNVAAENLSQEDVDYVEDFERDANAPITSDQNRINSIVDPVPDFDQQIQEFHNATINMEVWMVALGSEIDENAGMKAFLLEHAQELRGAIIIDIEGLGAGELSLINSEGVIRKSQTSSRMKRYVRSAANKLGVVIQSVDVPWGMSSAAYASKCGFKTLRLAGMEGTKPALYMSKNDVVENIDENKLKQNVKYLLQLIQTI